MFVRNICKKTLNVYRSKVDFRMLGTSYSSQPVNNINNTDKKCRRSQRLLDKSKPLQLHKYFSSQETKVVHDKNSNKFYIDIDGHDAAYLEYTKSGAFIDLVTTEVPHSLRERGLGKILAKAALMYCANNNLEVKVTCEFIRHFITKYEPQYIQYLEN